MWCLWKIVFFVEVMSNDRPAAKQPRSSEESQTSPEIED